MGEIFNDSLIILGFLAIVLAPMAIALAEPGAVQVGNSSHLFAVPSLRGSLFSPQVYSSHL
jgi:hypothetical protein